LLLLFFSFSFFIHAGGIDVNRAKRRSNTGRSDHFRCRRVDGCVQCVTQHIIVVI